MLSPKDFVTRWGNDAAPLVRFSTKGVEQLALSNEDKEFLLQAGLPEDAAPFLTFRQPESGELPTVAEEWHQSKEFRCYRLIGFDGSGNPIALDENHQGEVVCLDHESRFARILKNKSTAQLAESLLAYRKLVKDTQTKFGEAAFLDGRTSAADRNELRQELTRIDPSAMRPGCFWYGELQNLDANAV